VHTDTNTVASSEKPKSVITPSTSETGTEGMSRIAPHAHDADSHRRRGRGPEATRRRARAGQALANSASSAGLTSLQKMSIVRFASARVMSPVGICSTM